MHLRNLVAAGALALACMLSVSGAFAAAPSADLVFDRPSFVDVVNTDLCSPVAITCSDELLDVALLRPSDAHGAAFTCATIAQGLSPDPIGDMLRRYGPGWCSARLD